VHNFFLHPIAGRLREFRIRSIFEVFSRPQLKSSEIPQRLKNLLAVSSSVHQSMIKIKSQKLKCFCLKLNNTDIWFKF